MVYIYIDYSNILGALYFVTVLTAYSNISRVYLFFSPLAALNSSNTHGRNYINGNWGELNPSKKYLIPGTYVDYKRPMEGEMGESMIIPGPTQESMDVWVSDCVYI